MPPSFDSDDEVDAAHEFLALAAIRHAEHDLNGAAQLYTAVVCERPDEVEAWDGLGIVLFQQVRMLSDSLQAVRNLLFVSHILIPCVVNWRGVATCKPVTSKQGDGIENLRIAYARGGRV